VKRIDLLKWNLLDGAGTVRFWGLRVKYWQQIVCGYQRTGKAILQMAERQYECEKCR
jgi:hypothetical protein